MAEQTGEQHSPAVIAEDQLQSVFDSMKAMLEQFTSDKLFIDASLAYEAGLTSGFYGTHSFIAKAGRMQMAARYHQLKRNSEHDSYRSLLRRIMRIGAAHGWLILNHRWNDCEGVARVPRNGQSIDGIVEWLFSCGPIIQSWSIGQQEQG